MVEGEGRLGRKNSKGFYDYPESGPKRLWPGLKDLQATQLDPDTLDVAEMKSRLLVTQALEAARTVEEGVITDPREADVGSILGFGFAPYTGGALSYIDFMGAKAFVGPVRAPAGEARRPLRRAEDHPRHGGERRHVLRPRRGAQGSLRPRNCHSGARRRREPGTHGSVAEEHPICACPVGSGPFRFAEPGIRRRNGREFTLPHARRL